MLLFSRRLFGVSVSSKSNSSHSERAKHHGLILNTRPNSEVDELDLPLQLKVQVEADQAKRHFPERSQICHKYRTNVPNCSQDNCRKTGGPTARAGLTQLSLGGSGARQRWFINHRFRWKRVVTVGADHNDVTKQLTPTSPYPHISTRSTPLTNISYTHDAVVERMTATWAPSRNHTR